MYKKFQVLVREIWFLLIPIKLEGELLHDAQNRLLIPAMISQEQSSPIAENGDIVVFGDIAENGDIISPFSVIFHLPSYFGGYQGVHWKTRECNTRIQ